MLPWGESTLSAVDWVKKPMKIDNPYPFLVL